MRNKINPTIAILDSGIGGVGVLKSILSKQKTGNFIYFADNDFMPYGNKTQEELKQRLENFCDLLFNEFKVDYVIIACNTASTCLNNENPNIITMKFNQNYKYLATPLTAKNLINYNTIEDRTLASEIESNIFNFEKLTEIIKNHAQIHQLADEKAVVLGCTHYELVRSLFERFCPNTEFINNSEMLLKDLQFEMSKDEFNLVILSTKKDKSLEEKIYKLLNSPSFFAN